MAVPPAAPPPAPAARLCWVCKPRPIQAQRPAPASSCPHLFHAALLAAWVLGEQAQEVLVVLVDLRQQLRVLPAHLLQRGGGAEAGQEEHGEGWWWWW